MTPEPATPAPRAEPGPFLKRERWAAGLSIGAGLIHAMLSPSHLNEWWGYGLFFIFSAFAQIIFGIVLLAGGINPRSAGTDWRRTLRTWYIAGIVGNAMIIVLYVITRTVGIPQLGPAAGEVEKVGVIDVLSKLLEVALIVLLVRLARDWADAPPRA